MHKVNHIACIDDERDILEITRLCLETIGHYKVSSFLGGESALTQLPSLKPDLLLIDGLMPVMDGLQMLERVRKTPELAEIPAIFMTARVQPEEVKEYLDAGALGVIKKPFDPMKLVEEIETILDEKGSQTAPPSTAEQRHASD